MDQKQGNEEGIRTSMTPHYCLCISETERKKPEHMVDIPTDFNIAQSSECCIYRVPVNLRKVNPEAYTPQLIAIGPLHRENPALKPMEMEKSRYLEFFRQRCGPKLLQGFKSQLEKEEKKVRHYYAVKFPEESEYNKEFVEMIFLDAVFIMELFLRLKPDETKNCEENCDYIITNLWLRKSILRDLLLLENQIPMFVLEELYHTVVADVVAADKNQTRSDFHKLAGECFEIYHPKKSASSEESNKPTFNWRPTSKQLTGSSHDSASKASHKTNNGAKNWKNSRHFTDMIRYFYLPEDRNHPIFAGGKKIKKQNTATGEEQIAHHSSVLKTATQLNEGGVTFEKVKKHKCLLDIKFVKERFWSYFLCLSCLPKSTVFDCFKARFKIPQLEVDHWTECVFRNLIALEQCHYPDEPYICNYVSLIDSLIHTKDDVELLVDKEVISHDLGSHKELATMVNGLCKYVVVNETCYQETINDLNTHYKNTWNRYMAALRLVYFRDPWRASSTAVGVAVLVFAIFNFCRILRVVF